MRILVVEDEKALAKLVAERLMRDHYTVDISNDGESGLDNALSGMYDLIILDIMLPKMDGMEILKELRRQDREVKVIMLTAKAELGDRLQGFENGANDYVPKPFHIEELAARVNAQLNIGKAVDRALEYGDIVLDYKASKLRCTKNQEDVGINNKEFQLIEYLMSNADRILSREMIYDRIWGMESEAVSNNLEAYMSFVRKKLRVIGSNVAIRTIRNMGYRLEYEEKEG
ncbi:MAG: response regulator transcription factor [Lachnospiraceae bacterium]|nr:response regulator transcription factor [Lachnospiraceae bacterium]